jgi:ribosomal protein L11 methyltransferase
MYQPFNIGQRFRVVPPGHTDTAEGRIDLIMQRGAFGSGEHETTVSCLEILENLPDIIGKKVLDLGSGTGILAIAALKLGAASALCVDISAEAVATAQTNCEINGVADRVGHLIGTLETVEKDLFDLVLANIYGDILLSVAAPLASLTAPGGRLLLSGILWEYNFDIRSTYEHHGCEIISNRILNEFSTLLLRKCP